MLFVDLDQKTVVRVEQILERSIGICTAGFEDTNSIMFCNLERQDRYLYSIACLIGSQ